MIVKKTFIINQINNRYAVDGKTIGGLMRITSAGSNATAQLCLTNVNPARMGQWKVCLRVDGVVTVKDLPDLCEFSFPIPVVEGNCEADLLVCLVDGKVNPVAYATNKSFNAWNENLLQFFEEKKPQSSRQMTGEKEREVFLQQTKQEDNEPTLQSARRQPVSSEVRDETETIWWQKGRAAELKEKQEISRQDSRGFQASAESELVDYEKFVAAADNYYEKEREVVSPIDLSALKTKAQSKFTAVEEFSNAFEAYAQNPHGNYYIKIRQQLEQIFSQYPPYPALIERVADSYWVKIDYGEGSYFAVGLILERMMPKFLAYAVPSKELQQVSDNSFSLLGDRQNGYYILYQDADSGECVIGKP